MPLNQQIVVLVTFHSRCGTTETLALSAAVGAVQSRALIRLRRLPDSPAAAEPTAECAEELRRMQKEYVPPRDADVLGADGLVIAAPAGAHPSSPEWVELFGMLARLRADGSLAGKVAAVVDVGDGTTQASFSSVLGQLGLTLAPPDAHLPADPKERAIALGRRLADTARALKQTVG